MRQGEGPELTDVDVAVEDDDVIDVHVRDLHEAAAHIVAGGTERGINPELIGALVLATVSGRIKTLPQEQATSGRDYGRGYAAAIKDVLELLGV